MPDSTGISKLAASVPGPRLRRRHRRAARHHLGRRAGAGRHAPGGRHLRHLPQPGLRPGAARRGAAPAAGDLRARPGRHHRARTARATTASGTCPSSGWCRACASPPRATRATLRAELREAVAHRRRPDDRALPDRRRCRRTCPRCARSAASTCSARRDRTDVLLVAVGAFAHLGRRRGRRGSPSTATASPWSTRAGSGRCRSSWSAWPPTHRLVVVVEDGVRAGGVGGAVAQRCATPASTPRCARSGSSRAGTRTARRNEILADLGLTAQDVARQITGWMAALGPQPELGRRPPHRRS